MSREEVTVLGEGASRERPVFYSGKSERSTGRLIENG
jgi:hypothetical protein